MALGLLTKGPVALVIPGGAMFLLCASQRQWRRFMAWALPLGPLALFFAVAAPWFVVQTWQEGLGFLSNFFFKHNLSRFDTPMEGHGGNYFYYVPVVLLSLLPHTGLLLTGLGRLRDIWRDSLLRFGLLWFLVAFVLFSFSGTKLPHYVYYGYGGLVIVLAAMADRPVRRWLALLPAPLMFGLLLALPLILTGAASHLKPDDRLLLSTLPDAFGLSYWLWCGGALVLSLALLFLRRVDVALALRSNGVFAGVAMAALLIPAIGQVQQGPIRNAAKLARDFPGPLVLYGINTPSFQTYAGRQVSKRPPQPGDLVLTLGAGNMEIFRKIILPQLVPHIITACRVSLGVCWATLVAAELIAAQKGIGAMMVDAQNFFQMAPLVLGILMIGAISLVMDAMVRAVERRATSWQEKMA